MEKRTLTQAMQEQAELKENIEMLREEIKQLEPDHDTREQRYDLHILEDKMLLVGFEIVSLRRKQKVAKVIYSDGSHTFIELEEKEVAGIKEMVGRKADDNVKHCTEVIIYHRH